MAVPGIHRHPQQGRIVRTVLRTSPETVERLARTYSAFLLDLVGKEGCMTGLKSLSPGMRVCGPAVTVWGPDLSLRRMAINLAEPGDVLVCAAGGSEVYASFGDGTALRMQLKGIAGVVIDGSTRDAGGIRKLGFPTWVKGVTPRNYHYPEAPHHGAINIPVVCGGALVNPGDLIFGDDDGAVVIPREFAEEKGEWIATELDNEVRERAAWSGFEPYPVEDELRERGFRFEP